jgi:hypothetical protein
MTAVDVSFYVNGGEVWTMNYTGHQVSRGVTDNLERSVDGAWQAAQKEDRNVGHWQLFMRWHEHDDIQPNCDCEPFADTSRPVREWVP